MTAFRTLTLAAALACGTSLAMPAFAQTANPEVGGAAMMADMDIIANASNSPIHTTLVAAVQAAGLVETLKGPGPFTVFAPTDEAFAALPEGTVETLLMPENLEMLQKVLTCHVVAANAMSDAIATMISDDGGRHAVDTVGGCTLQVYMDGDMLMIEDETGGMATVTIADVVQSNGVIHVIDAVLLPAQEDAAAAPAATDAAMASDAAPAADAAMASDTTMADAGSNPTVGGAPMMADMDIVANAVNSPIHTTLVAAVQAADLVETLQGPGPFTVFAPTDEAFAALPAGTVDTLLMPENKGQLQKVLTAHVVPGRLTAADLTSGLSGDEFRNLETVSGDALSVQTTADGKVFVFDENGNAFEVTVADVMQSNGVIHVVEGVLLPR